MRREARQQVGAPVAPRRERVVPDRRAPAEALLDDVGTPGELGRGHDARPAHVARVAASSSDRRRRACSSRRSRRPSAGRPLRVASSARDPELEAVDGDLDPGRQPGRQHGVAQVVVEVGEEGPARPQLGDDARGPRRPSGGSGAARRAARRGRGRRGRAAAPATARSIRFTSGTYANAARPDSRLSAVAVRHGTGTNRRPAISNGPREVDGAEPREPPKLRLARARTRRRTAARPPRASPAGRGPGGSRRAISLKRRRSSRPPIASWCSWLRRTASRRSRSAASAWARKSGPQSTTTRRAPQARSAESAEAPVARVRRTCRCAQSQAIRGTPLARPGAEDPDPQLAGLGARDRPGRSPAPARAASGPGRGSPRPWRGAADTGSAASGGASARRTPPRTGSPRPAGGPRRRGPPAATRSRASLARASAAGSRCAARGGRSSAEAARAAPSPRRGAGRAWRPSPASGRGAARR